MLNKNNFEIARLCPKPDDHSLYSMDGIRVTPTGTTVTDGHVLLRVSGVQDPEDFDPFILPARTALRIANALPTRQRECSHPEAQIRSTDAGKLVVDVMNTDLDVDSYSISPIDGKRKFPDADRVIPAKKGATGDVLLDLDILVPLLERIRKFHGNQTRTGPRIRRLATFRFYKTTGGESVNDHAQRIDAKNDLDQEITAVIMPCRPSGG